MTVPTFPTLASIGFPKRAPVWSTVKQPSVGGQESRFSLWSSPRWRYEFPAEVLRQNSDATEFAALVGFYNTLGGSAGTFQYSDPNDGSVTAQAFSTGDGTTRSFQLVRTLGGFTEPVYLPTSQTIYVNGTSTSAYTLGTSGILTFVTAPAAAAALTWTGSFNWLCNFDDDSVDFQQFGAGLWSMQSLKFSTVKL